MPTVVPFLVIHVTFLLLDRGWLCQVVERGFDHGTIDTSVVVLPVLSREGVGLAG